MIDHATEFENAIENANETGKERGIGIGNASRTVIVPVSENGSTTGMANATRRKNGTERVETAHTEGGVVIAVVEATAVRGAKTTPAATLRKTTSTARFPNELDSDLTDGAKDARGDKVVAGTLVFLLASS